MYNKKELHFHKPKNALRKEDCFEETCSADPGNWIY